MHMFPEFDRTRRLRNRTRADGVIHQRVATAGRMLAILVALFFAFERPALAQGASRFRVGAARADITPPPAALRSGDSIRDMLNVRSVYVENGATCAVLVGVDHVGLADAVTEKAIKSASQDVGCPAANFIISATHTHSGSSRTLMDPSGEPSSSRVVDAIVSATVEAKRLARPAKIGFGSGKLDLNVNRDLFGNGRWMQGPNPNGPSDKTLAVLQFVDDNDLPIAVYVNYAMHPINFYLSGIVSSDVPGEASRYVEARYGSGTVVIFAQGASGDQNPKHTQALYDLIEARAGLPEAGNRKVTREGFWARSSQSRNLNATLVAAMSKPVSASGEAAYRLAAKQQDVLITAQGAVMGESVIDVMRFATSSFSDQGDIAAAATVVQCPGRDRADTLDPIREGALPPYADGPPVRIKEGVLRLGDVYLTWVNGEVYNEIGTRLKRVAPVSALLMTTLANGFANSGYIYSDEASDHLTFQVISSRLKPGCAEDQLVDKALGLIDALKP